MFSGATAYNNSGHTKPNVEESRQRIRRQERRNSNELMARLPVEKPSGRQRMSGDVTKYMGEFLSPKPKPTGGKRKTRKSRRKTNKRKSRRKTNKRKSRK